MLLVRCDRADERKKAAYTYVNLCASDIVRASVESRHFRQPRDGMLRAGIRRRLGPRDVCREGAVVNDSTYAMDPLAVGLVSSVPKVN